ncbi:MAG: hypothetical protein JST58_01495 [Bacteroidetes bacterium]|nr:hypothetical protein [Bacteroidota bacterium]
MNLNDTKLNTATLVGLYKNVLVASPQKVQDSELATNKKYKFLGKNKKSVLLVNDCKDAVFVSEKELNFISKLLEACKMNLEDIAIVNKASEDINITELKNQLAPKTIIFFGVAPTDIKLPIHFPMFKLQEYDGCVYLSAPNLEELDQNTNEGKILKSKLWVCLKQLFGL